MLHHLVLVGSRSSNDRFRHGSAVKEYVNSQSSIPIDSGEDMQSRSSQPEAIAITESETYQTLLARAHRRTGGVPPESIVRHVLSVTQGGDWPVQRDALEAVLRRCASAHTDEIQIVGRPRGRPLGLYATRRRGSRARPYRTLLRRIEPLDGSCECADFLRNSLGLCKHLVAVLEHVASKRRRGDVERESAPEPAPLRWDPVRPLTGPGDWLARVRWVDGTPDRGLRRWLRPANGNGWTVAVPEASQQRLALVDRLLAALRDGDGEPALHALLQRRARATRAPDPDREHPEAPAPGAAHPQAIALSLSARRRRAVLRARAPAPGRRHGSRQDRAGDRRLPRPLAHRPRPPRPDRRARRAQAAVAARVAALHRRSRHRRRRHARPAPRRVRGVPARIPPRQLRAAPPRPRHRSRVEAGPRRARRGPADQELGDEDRALREAAGSAVPPGADRHADGEPARRAGLDRRVGRRPGAGAEVAPGRVAHHARGRKRGDRRRPQPRYAADAARPCMVRRVRQEVLAQLPARTDTRFPSR